VTLAFLLRSRVTHVWIGLIAITVFSWSVARAEGVNRAGLVATAIMLLAFLKVRLIMLDFMELRHAPPMFRVACELWIVVLCSALLILYWQGHGSR